MKTKKVKEKIVIALGLVAYVWLCIFISQFLSLYFFRALMNIFNLEAGTLLQSVYSAFIYVLAIVLMLGIPVIIRKCFPGLKTHPLFEKTSREELGIKGLPTWTDILLSPVGFVTQLILSYAFTALFTLLPWFDAGEAQDTGYSDLLTTGDRLLAFLIIAVVAPIAEEIIFRGYLYGRLRKHLDLPVSMLLTSLLFAFLHGQWNVGVNVFAVSLVLCFLRETTGTIYSGILVHILKNALAFYLLFIAL